MDFIKEWAVGITLISFAGGIVFILLPKGNTAKTVKSVVSVIIIISCALPFLGGKKFETGFYVENLSEGYDDYDFLRVIDRQQLEFVEERLKNEIEKILKKYSAEAVKIRFDDNINGEGRIEINKVTVYLREKYSYLDSNIHDDIFSVLGIENEVIVSGVEKSTSDEKEVDG